MAKMRIYELARELVEKGLAKDSKTLNTDIINLLVKKGVEVKSHQSGVSDEDADYVRAHYSKSNKDTKKSDTKADKKPEVKAEEKPEKKVEEKVEVKAEAKAEEKTEAKQEAKQPAPEKTDRPARPEAADPAKAGKRRPPAGKLIGKGGKETPYWIGKEGRLIGADGKPLPLKLNENGKIVKLDGSPLQKRPAPPVPGDKDVSTKIGTDISKNTDKAPVANAAENKAVNVNNEAVKPVEEKASEPQKAESNEPQPRIVGNIFESLAAAKDKEQAIKEKRAAQQQQGRPERNGEKRPFDPNRQGGRPGEGRPDRRDGRPGEGRPDRRDGRPGEGRPGEHRSPFRDSSRSYLVLPRFF